MSDTSQSGPPDRFVYDPDRQPELFDGVLSKRIVAFVVDVIVIALLMIPVGAMVFVLGFLTLGLAWFLFPPLTVIVALAYFALTLGGRRSASVGMRVAGIEFRTWSGAPMFPLLAIMHAILFWFSVSLLTPFIILVGLFTYRRQLLHDLLLGVVALNSDPLARN